MLILLLSLLVTGCSPALLKDIRLSSMAQKQQIHELIRSVQGEIDNGGQPSSFQLLLLASSYYEIRDYDRAFSTTSLMEKQIGAGDRSMVGGGDLSPYPNMLRSKIYLDFGDAEHAIREAQSALGMLDRNNFFYSSQLIDCASSLGIASALKGDERAAERYLAMVQTAPDAGPVVGVDRQIALAKILTATGRYNAALQALNDPVVHERNAAKLFYDQTFQKLPVLFIQAHCEFTLGDFVSARRDLEQLLRHPYIQQIGSIYWQVLYELAQVELREGRIVVAETLLKQAIEVVEQQRASIASEAGRIGFVGDKQALYQELVELLCRAGQPAAAFEYVERSKSRALVDLLAGQKELAPRNGEGSHIRQSWHQLQAEEKLAAVVSESTTGSVVTQKRGISMDLRQSLAAEAPEFASLVTVGAPSAAELQRLLDPQQTLLEYYKTGAGWVAFLVTRSSVTATLLEAATIEDDVQSLRQGLLQPDSNSYDVPARRLYTALVAPVAAQIQGRRLTVIPHGVLHYIPFAALKDQERYLLDRYELSILPSASLLAYLQSRETHNLHRALVVGNPELGDPRLSLRYAEEEAVMVARTFPGATLLLRDQARSTFVVARGGDYDILHLALHGKFDPDSPLDSALFFAKSAAEDGLLKASDLYTLRLHAELVTLSACETALGKVLQGDDVVGFSRGLLYAGARAILSSLWTVDDLATRDLMVAFYANLAGEGKAEALRRAQLAVRSKYAHPYYWAAFQLTGL